jgi:hypothetical protein
MKIGKDITVSGLKGYTPQDTHFDVAGTWGGKRAVVAHLIPEGGETYMERQELFMYVLVGNFWEVGLERDKPGISKWDVAKLVTKAMQNGVDPNSIYERVKDICTPSS